MDPDIESNRQILRECLCQPILLKVRSGERRVQQDKRPRARRRRHAGNLHDETTPDDADIQDLADFINYLSDELFDCLQPTFQKLSYASVMNDERLALQLEDPLPKETAASLISSIPSEVADSLITYSIVDDLHVDNFLLPIYQEYINVSTAKPPPNDPTKRATACEICERDWIPLTYHHLIPREMHAKAVKRKWHEAWRLDSVAWLCRACHSFVHRAASNEELARDWWSVERLLTREDVQSWSNWVGRIRWKSR